jgi:hypothetical protein
VNPVLPAVVIGAGPYGLSTAAHLQRLPIPVRVFGEPMDTWRNRMPAGMFLKSEPFASDLSAPSPGFTLADYCRGIGQRPLDDWEPVPVDLFIDYGLWFAKHQVPEVEQTHVVHVERQGDGPGERRGRDGAAFQVTLASGERFGASVVVVASGVQPFPYVPEELDGPEELVTHTSRHHDLSDFAGRKVAMIGAGQSALEGAALLAEAGAEVEIYVRGKKVIFDGDPIMGPVHWTHRILKPKAPLGDGWSHVAFSRGGAAFRHLPESVRLHLVRTILGPFGSWWLRDRVLGKIPIHTERPVLGVTPRDGGALLRLGGPQGPSETLVDHVMAATGYRVDLDRIGFLAPELRGEIALTGRSPHLSAGFESSVRGLFFTGLPAAATFGPVLRFVCGTDFAARGLTRGVARRLDSPGRTG